MPIKVTCACGKVTMVPDAYAGRTGKCPACKQPVKVPMLETAGAVAQPAAQPQPRKAPAPAQEPQYEPEPESESQPEAEPAYEAAGDDAPAGEESADYEVAESRPPQSLQYAAPAQGSGGLIAPPPSDAIQIPTALSEQLRQPNSPPLHVVLSTAGSDVRTKFDASPLLVTLVETLAKKTKKQFDVRLDPPTPGEAAPIVFVRVIRINPGNRFLRNFGWLGALIGGATCFEIDGNVQMPEKQPLPFNLKHKSYFGIFFGGSSRNLLTINAKVLGKKIAGQIKKAGK